MKFALASLLAVASAGDFPGCAGSNWGDFPAMKVESDCIFNELNDQHDLQTPDVHGALVHYCLVNSTNENYHNSCQLYAETAGLSINSQFGPLINKSDFFIIYLTVKYNKQQGNTMGPLIFSNPNTNPLHVLAIKEAKQILQDGMKYEQSTVGTPYQQIVKDMGKNAESFGQAIHSAKYQIWNDLRAIEASKPIQNWATDVNNITNEMIIPPFTSKNGRNMMKQALVDIEGIYKDEIKLIDAMSENNDALLVDEYGMFVPTKQPAAANTSSLSASLGYAAFNGATAPTSNPCVANIGDTSLTDAMVRAQDPGVYFGPKLVTAQQMQCWAWLATQSKEAHPARAFAKQFGHEPYLLI